MVVPRHACSMTTIRQPFSTARRGCKHAQTDTYAHRQTPGELLQGIPAAEGHQEVSAHYPRGVGTDLVPDQAGKQGNSSHAMQWEDRCWSARQGPGQAGAVPLLLLSHSACMTAVNQYLTSCHACRQLSTNCVKQSRRSVCVCHLCGLSRVC